MVCTNYTKATSLWYQPAPKSAGFLFWLWERCVSSSPSLSSLHAQCLFTLLPPLKGRSYYLLSLKGSSFSRTLCFSFALSCFSCSCICFLIVASLMSAHPRNWIPFCTRSACLLICNRDYEMTAANKLWGIPITTILFRISFSNSLACPTSSARFFLFSIPSSLTHSFWLVFFTAGGHGPASYVSPWFPLPCIYSIDTAFWCFLSDLPDTHVLLLDDFSSVFRAEHDVILAHLLGMRQTVCLVCHTSHLSFCNGPQLPYCPSKVPFWYNYFYPPAKRLGFVLLRSTALRH